jgi:hypothetical protein
MDENPDEEWWQQLVPSEEDRLRMGFPLSTGGYRWFRANNIVVLDQERRKRAKRNTPPSTGNAA